MYIGAFRFVDVPETFVVPVVGPVDAAIRISPDGTSSFSLIETGKDQAIMTLNTTTIIVDITGSSTRILARPGDQVFQGFAQPNDVSFFYRAIGEPNAFVSCIVPPSFNATNSSIISGHLIVNANSTLAPASTTTSVAGTLVIGSGSVLQLPCASGVNAINATWIVGNFSSIAASCATGCTPTFSETLSSSSLSVAVTLTCSSSGLSTGAIVGIAIGAAVGAGVLIGVGVGVYKKVQTALYKSEFQKQQQVELTQRDQNSLIKL